jgi:hypothetical protein
MCSSPEQLAALQIIAKPGHILFGSDFPNCPPDAIERFTKQLDASEVLSSEYRKDLIIVPPKRYSQGYLSRADVTLVRIDSALQIWLFT